MKILKKITLRNLKLNQKRSVGTIIGIILSVAMISAVGSMAASFRQTLINATINNDGNFHIALYDINETKTSELLNNRYVKNINILNNIGISKLPSSKTENKPYVEVYSLTEQSFDNLSLYLTKGRFPQNETELVIASTINSNADNNYEVGDQITLNLGTRVNLNNEVLASDNEYDAPNEKIINAIAKTYTIVGIIDRPSGYIENYRSPCYTALTTNVTTNDQLAFIELNNPRTYKKALSSILEVNNYQDLNKSSYHYNINEELLRYQGFKLSDDTLKTLYILVSIIIGIILISSIFCIRNAFAISTTEKTKMYGMLSSIGATKKQIKKSVFEEASYLGLIGIPLGLLSGIIATFILLKLVNFLLKDFFNNILSEFTFTISIYAIILAIILGILTIYLSAFSSARKASKISPIDQIRNAADIKINIKKIHCPKFIKKIFGIGGVIAYNSLKRSRKKYRTTVISLVVSIAIFISLFSFMNYGFKSANSEYKKFDYNITVYGVTTEKLDQIKQLDNIDHLYITYTPTKEDAPDKSTIYPYLTITDTNYFNPDSSVQEYIKNNTENGYDLNLIALDDATYQSYINKLKLNYNDLKDKSILIDNYRYMNDSNQITYTNLFNIPKSGLLKGNLFEEEQSFTIGAITDIAPYGYEFGNSELLVVNAAFYPQITWQVANVNIDSSNSEALSKELSQIINKNNFQDYSAIAKMENSMLLVIAIFLYGFISVITLIGITNIFNTITSNMELRQKEFAMLKSIGMTHREFNRMINLETCFYSLKSLAIGIIIGLLGSYAIYKALASSIDFGFIIPYKAILICIIFVFLLISLIMHYSITKINKQNTIETIRNENI